MQIFNGSLPPGEDEEALTVASLPHMWLEIAK
jgi:hypothetical protein